MERFICMTEENIADAARIHAASWQESHRSFCSEEFVALHTPERQEDYLRKEMAAGKRIWLLEVNGENVGLVSVLGSLIENLYVAPEKQNRGYGTKLLLFAIAKCEGLPTLWILDNNHGAKRLYERNGFKQTGKRKQLTDTLYEIELEVMERGHHDLMADALFETKSLEALAYLLNAGRELEFSYHGAMGFISCDGSKRGVSLWMNRTEQSFADIMELIDNAMIEGKAFRSAWNEIEFETLF